MACPCGVPVFALRPSRRLARGFCVIFPHFALFWYPFLAFYFPLSERIFFLGDYLETTADAAYWKIRNLPSWTDELRLVTDQIFINVRWSWWRAVNPLSLIRDLKFLKTCLQIVTTSKQFSKKLPNLTRTYGMCNQNMAEPVKNGMFQERPKTVNSNHNKFCFSFEQMRIFQVSDVDLIRTLLVCNIWRDIICVQLSTHVTKFAFVYRQITDFVYRLLWNKSNMIWNFLSRVHTCNLSMNSQRTLCRVKRPLLARFLDNLTEIMCVKEQVVEFFLRWSCQHCYVMWYSLLMCTVTILLEKK